MGNENLYEIVKNRICDEIFKGHYSDADKLPPERELEEMLEVSRVTVRKSLEILEDDGLIVRQVGRGTTVTLRNRGNKSELDMIVLIAPARNPFFAEFIGRFFCMWRSRVWKNWKTVSIGCTNGGCAMRSSGWRTFRWMWRS